MNDRLYFDAEEGDIVAALLEGTHPGEEDLICDMQILSIEEQDDHFYLVQLTPLTFGVEELADTLVVYSYRLCLGDGFVFNPSDGYMVNAETGERVDKPPGSKMNGKLVGLNNGRFDDISAKYEAYMDPCIAALSETPGRITRNRHYPTITVNKI